MKIDFFIQFGKSEGIASRIALRHFCLMDEIIDKFSVLDEMIGFKEGFKALHCCEQNRFLRIFNILFNKFLYNRKITLKTATSSTSRGTMQMAKL